MRLGLRFTIALAVATAACSERSNLLNWASSAGQAALTSDTNIRLSASNLAPNPNDPVDFQLQSPALADSAMIAQTLDAEWDPHFVIATPPTVPDGWATTYYAGPEQLAGAPNDASGWSAVTRVVTSGAYHADGVLDGNQFVIGNANARAPLAANFAGGVTGDGWDVFFDDTYTRIFNIIHHNGPDFAHPFIMCRNLADASVCPGYPLATMNTDGRSTGYYDAHTLKIWHPTWVQTGAFDGDMGFECIDVSGPTPTFCSQRFVVAAHGQQWWGWVSGATVVGRELYTFQFETGKLLCLNLDTGGLCTGQPFDAGVSAPLDMGSADLFLLNGQIHTMGYVSYTQQGNVNCFDPSTKQLCAGMQWPKTTTHSRPFWPVPDPDGTINNLCLESDCWGIDGSATTVAPEFIAYVQSGHGTGGFSPAFSRAAVSGSRLYWPDPGWHMTCFDMNTKVQCPNWGIGVPSLYTITVDPENPYCMWTNGDDGVIRNWDTPSGTIGCKTPAPTARFKPQVALPRLGCDANAQVAGWDSFTLTNPSSSSFVSASLTVTDNFGNPVPGWAGVDLDNNPVDLSTLPVSATGQKPVFKVDFTNLTDTSPPTATFRVIGQVPQVCWHATTTAICPGAGGLAPTSIAPTSPGNANANGSYAVASGGSVAMQPNSISYPALANNTDVLACSADLGGLLVTDASRLVYGVTASLLYTDNAPVLDGSANAIQVMSDANGLYQFPHLLVGRYRVQLQDASPWTLTSVNVSVGGSGTTPASSGAAISNTSSITHAARGVVNGLYSGTPTCSSGDQCTQGVCDASDSRCGIVTGAPGCTVTDPSLCRSGFCSSGNICIPPGGCYVDLDCPKGQNCDRQAYICVLDFDAGQPIPNDGLHDGTCASAAEVCLTGLCNPNTVTCGRTNGNGCTNVNQCVSNLCGNNGACGLNNGQSGCTASACQSGVCSSADVCIPSGGCYIDMDCSAAQYCNRGTLACTGDLGAGVALPSDGLHDGSCTAAAAACTSQLCNATTLTCALANGQACTAANQCVANVCGSNGQCGIANGDSGCTPSTAASACQSGACSANANVCIPTPGSCWADADCDSAHFCNRGTTTCSPKLLDGNTIALDGLHDGTCTAANANAVCASGLCNPNTLTCGGANGASCTNPGDCAVNLCGSNS